MVTIQEALPENMGADDAAKFLGLSRRAVLQRIQTGKLPATRIGRQTYSIKTSDLLVAKEAGRMKPGPAKGTPRKKREDVPPVTAG